MKDYLSKRGNTEQLPDTHPFFDNIKKRLLIAITVTAIFGLGVLLFVLLMARDLPSLTQLENFDPSLITRIRSTDGVVVGELYTQRRVLVPLEKIPPYMEYALLATEDQQFYNHWGVNVTRTFKALAVDFVHLSWAQGASTVTQQLARNMYDTIGFHKTLLRKVKEAITAIQIERTYTKTEIMEMYLNQIYFGHGVYGIEAAAREFYGKRAEDLSLDEAATLVGLLRLPAYYSPVNHPDRARSRRNVVLRLMRDQGYISQKVYDHYSELPIRSSSSGGSNTGLAPYFTEYIRQELEKQSKALGIDLYQDGLTIYTTLDSRVQAAAESAYRQYITVQQNVLNNRLLSDVDELASIVDTSQFGIDTLHAMIRGQAPMDSTLRSKLLVQGALIAIEPGTGHILAMIGGRNFSESKFNRAVQAKRQPGSVFKPFLYTTAIDAGYPVTQELLNQPVVLIDESTGKRWNPSNYDGTTGGPTTLREGLRRSLNLVSVRLVQQLVTPQAVVSQAHRMGITTNLRAVDAIALGTSEVIPLEVTAAYAIFPNQGIWVEPIAITRIEDRFGNVLKEYTPMKKEVLSEETSYIMTDMLQTVLKEGTGQYAPTYGFEKDRPGGGKTGTTQDWTDAWFVGFTPHIAAGVWVGMDDPSVSLGRGRAGSVAAMPMWATFMAATDDTLNIPKTGFERPEGVVEIKICSESKKLPTPYCPTETEIFNKNYVPTEVCDIHGQINTATERDNNNRRTF